jgi:hypothetical protein
MGGDTLPRLGWSYWSPQITLVSVSGDRPRDFPGKALTTLPEQPQVYSTFPEVGGGGLLAEWASSSHPCRDPRSACRLRPRQQTERLTLNATRPHGA